VRRQRRILESQAAGAFTLLGGCSAPARLLDVASAPTRGTAHERPRASLPFVGDLNALCACAAHSATCGAPPSKCRCRRVRCRAERQWQLFRRESYFRRVTRLVGTFGRTGAHNFFFNSRLLSRFFFFHSATSSSFSFLRLRSSFLFVGLFPATLSLPFHLDPILNDYALSVRKIETGSRKMAFSWLWEERARN